MYWDCGEKFTAICFASAFTEWMSSRRTERRKMRKSESAKMQKQHYFNAKRNPNPNPNPIPTATPTNTNPILVASGTAQFGSFRSGHYEKVVD